MPHDHNNNNNNNNNNHNHHHHHHGHSCHSESCDHDHSNDGPDRGFEFTLYRQVDTDHVVCLNELEAGSIKHVFKTWEERFERTKIVQSDADEELLIHIPFTGSVKLKSVAILGGSGESAPAHMKLYINRETLDFDSVGSTEPDQEFEMVQDPPANEIPEYPVKITKFSNVRTLSIYIDANFGADSTVVSYIGLKGEWTELKKDPIITLYEAAPNPADHKVKGVANNAVIGPGL